MRKLLIFAACLAWAHVGPPPEANPPGSLDLLQSEYQLRAGEATVLAAAPEAAAFLLHANIRTVRISGPGEGGLVVGPGTRKGEVLLAASLSVQPGEYTVVVGAANNGERRSAPVRVRVLAPRAVSASSTQPPVILMNGWQTAVGAGSCPLSSSSAAVFGSLQATLAANGISTFFFDNCAACPGCTIEDLGNSLGSALQSITFTNGAPVPQFDLVAYSIGGLIARSYLAGLQISQTLAPPPNPRIRKLIEIAAPNYGSFLANTSLGMQVAEIIPGSSLLWQLARWNQGSDDLRGVDALAIAGNGGGGSNGLANAGDGVVSLTSASVGFAMPAARTRILPYCHTDPAIWAGSLLGPMNCFLPSIANVDEAPQTGQIILSFLANTTLWQSIGTIPTQDPYLSQFGGMFFALENSAGQYLTDITQVTLGGVQLTPNGAIFHNGFLKGTGTWLAVSQSLGSVNCGSYTPLAGRYNTLRCKYPPAIISIGPLQSGISADIVQSGANITINGAGFGQTQCGSCQVTVLPGNTTLQVSSWTDSAITAFLPSNFTGAISLGVQTAGGQDAFTFMSSPAGISLSLSAGTSSNVAPSSQVSAYAASGVNLATTTAQAGAPPWPATLGGTSVSVTDSAGTARSAVISFVSPGQVNFVMPDGTAAGAATVTVTAGDGTASSGPVNVAKVAPGLYMLNTQSLAAANVVRVASGGGQTNEPVFEQDASGNLVARPIDVSAASGQVFLVLYGTGIRGADLSSVTATVGGDSVPVSFAGDQKQYPGFDQVNLGPLPASLAGQGDVVIQVTAAGITANPVHVTIQ